MKYGRRSFSVAVSNGKGSTMCAEQGHSAADSKGNCLCCGQPVSGSDIIVRAGNLDASTEPGVAIAHISSKTRYFELMGGPHDGEIISGDDAARDNIVTPDGDLVLDGECYRFADSDRGLLRLHHVPTEPVAT